MANITIADLANIGSILSTHKFPMNAVASPTADNYATIAQMDVYFNDIQRWNEKTSIVADDVFLIEDSNASLVNKKVKWSTLATYAKAIHALSEKTTLVAADEFLINDSADLYSSKRVLYATILSQLPIASLTEKTTPIGADELLLSDSEAGNTNKKIKLNKVIDPSYIHGLCVTVSTTALTVLSGFSTYAGGCLSFDSDQTITPTAISGGGYKWRCLCIEEATSSIVWKNLSDFDNVGYALSETTNQLDLYTLYDNAYGYCRGKISTTYYRVFYVFKQFSTFTDATVDTLSTKILNCDATTKFSIGQKVSGTDIPSNSEIVEIINSTSVRLNNTCTGTHSNITMTVANGIVYGMNVENIPKRLIKCYKHTQIRLDGYTGTYPLGMPLPYDCIEIDTLKEITWTLITTGNYGNYHKATFAAKYNSKVNIMYGTGTYYSSGGNNWTRIYVNSALYLQEGVGYGNLWSRRIVETLDINNSDTVDFYGLDDGGGSVYWNYTYELSRNIFLIIE
jgi:hypothetical protein